MMPVPLDGNCLELTINQLTGRCFYAKGYRFACTKLSESSFEINMFASQCHSTRMLSLSLCALSLFAFSAIFMLARKTNTVSC